MERFPCPQDARATDIRVTSAGRRKVHDSTPGRCTGTSMRGSLPGTGHRRGTLLPEGTGMDLERTPLLGVGMSYAFTTAAGQRAAVIIHVDGRREIVLYDTTDRERVQHTLVLAGMEPRTVAELLGSPLITDHLGELIPALDGVETARLRIPAQSPFHGRPLGDTRARTRTGASIVAVVRDDRVIPSPGPDFVLRPGDSLVSVGDSASLVKLRELFTDG